MPDKEASSSMRQLPAHLRYARLTTDLPPEPKRSPSELSAELHGTARPAAALQRPRVVALLNMSEFTHNVESIVPLEEPLFQPSPPEVVFDAFEAHSKYTATLRFRNNDSVNRRLKVLKIDSVHFEVVPPKGTAAGGSKVAPGMEIAYKIIFTPRAEHDFAAELVCLSEREKFVVMISARGPRPCFEFPDGVDFGLQPVRASASEAFLLRNTGTADGRFVLSVPAPFSVTPSDGALKAGEAMQLSFGFKPELRGEYAEELLIEYDSGERCYARLAGASSDVEVGLERSLLVLEPCYISLLSQTTLKLHNRSDVKVSFSWKALRSAMEDEQRRTDELIRLDDAAGSMAPHALRTRRRLVEEDPLPFSDAIFAVDPLEGEIFPNSYCELTIAFRPQNAGEAAVTAFCEITGRESRLPLTLQGRGLGPKATWLYDSLDIADVYVNSEHKYEVVLENHGDIDCDYSLEPNNSLMASYFTFTPNAGHLRSRQQQMVEVRFCSSMLGELNETFVWKLHGQPDPLPLVLKGRVVAPSFSFDDSAKDGLHFSHVSLGFVNTRKFTLSNTSEIPMRFRLRIPNEHGLAHDEFEVQPSSGIILPQGEQPLKLNFIATQVCKYNLSMLVDVEAVGDSLLSLPISAECLVPGITPSADALEYGDAFIHHTYSLPLTIRNPSHLPAKFEVIDEAPMLKAIGEHEVTPHNGEIAAKSSIDVVVKFTTRRLGPMSLPLYVRIVGLEEAAFCVELNAKAIGPNVLLSAPKLDFGKAPVLKDVPRALTLDNQSLIPAVFKAVLRKAGSPFSLEAKEFTMKAGEKRDFVVKVHTDDTVKTTNDLILQIKYASEVIVPLSATGIGATISASRDMSSLSFGENFSSRILKDEFVLTNLGRRPQSLTWINNATIPPPKDKKDPEAAIKPLPPPIFNITPDKVLMEPGASCTFVVRALAHSAGERTETLVCAAQVAGGQGKPEPLYETAVTCTFIEPIVEATPSVMEYVYSYVDGDEAAPVKSQKQRLMLKNTSPLALTMTLKAPPPFSSSKSEIFLIPDEATTVDISYDPNFPGDLVSRKFEDTRLQMAFREHPQKLYVNLLAQTHFPNLSMSLTEGAFGCLLNDSPAKMTMQLTNTSSVGAYYSWNFSQDGAVPADTGLAFDILPIRGFLEAGASETVELLYKGGHAAKARATAICEVVGGPTYELPLSADTSEVQYKLTADRLDFGLQAYDRVEEKELFLHNTGRVLFSYHCDKTMLSRSNVVEVLPEKADVKPGDKLKILVRCLPGLPQKLTELLYIHVAHFPAEEVVVVVEGIYPRISLNLPRDRSDELTAAYFDEAEAKIAEEKIKEEAERAGAPLEPEDAPLVELTPADVCASLSNKYESFSGLLESWGKLARDAVGGLGAVEGATLSLDEFKTALLATLGIVSTAAAASTSFASLVKQAAAAAAEDGAEAVDVSDAAPAQLSVAFLLEMCAPPKAKKVHATGLPAPPFGGADGLEGADVTVDFGATADEDAMAMTPREGGGLGETVPSPPQTGMSRGPAASMRSDATGRYRVFADNEADVEAERLYLAAYSSEVLSTHGPEFADFPPGTGASRVQSASTTRGRYAPKLDPLPPVAPNFVLATYVLDFGNVIKGAQKKKVFKLRNCGWNYVSLDIDKNAIAPYGLRVEPDKLVKLPGLPDSETAEFTVTFASKAGKVGLGRMTHELRLQLKPGPPVAILVKANVTIPEIKLTVPDSIQATGLGADSIDFANVICGQCLTATVELYNPKEVVASWSIKPPLEAAKDFGFFTCLPDSGNLAPGGRFQMQIRFAPNTERPFGCRLMMKIESNNKPVYLNCIGQGKELKVITAPDGVVVPAVMPHGAPNSATFNLHNPSDYPIEVYSVDFDQEYLGHEAIVREDASAPTVGNDNLLLPPRAPGETFWEGLTEAHEEKLRLAAEAAEAERRAAEGEEGEEGAEGAEGAESKDAPAAAEPEGVGDLEAAEEEAEPKQRTLIVLTPAPLARSAEIAAELAFSYQVPVVALAEVVAAEHQRLVDEALAAKEEARQAKVAEAMAAAEAAGEEYAPAEEDADEAEADEPLPLALEADVLSACITGALAREAQADGAVIVLPEAAVPHATTQALLDAVAAALPEEPKWSFALQTLFKDEPPPPPLQEGDEGYEAPADGEEAEAPPPYVPKGEETVVARAAAQLAAAIAALPAVGAIPDMEEEAYEALEPHARAAFEEKRREHRRKLACAEAKVAAAKLSHEFRLTQLQATSEAYTELAEAGSAHFYVAPPEAPEPEPEPEEGWPEGEAPEPWAPPRGLPGHHVVDASLPMAEVIEALEGLLFVPPPPIPEEEPPPPIPLPFGNQILKRPRARQQRQAPLGLVLYTMPPPPPPKPEVDEGEEGAEPPAAAAEEGEGEEAEPPEPTLETRWVLPAKESVLLRVDYSSAKTWNLPFRMQHALKFEVMGLGDAKGQCVLNTSALVEFPKISTDPRSVFSRKVKAREPLKVKKSYVVQRRCFEYGPLLCNRPQPPEPTTTTNEETGEETLVEVPPHKDHVTPLHITNTSPFPLTVHFSFLANGVALHTHQPRPFSPPPPPPVVEEEGEEEGAESKEAPPAAAEPPEPRAADAPPVFFLQETSMTLEPDQTKDLRISAFPDMDGLFEESLMCTITDNPEPVQFPISCIGSTPSVALSSQAVAFERLLMGRSDTKLVQIASRSALPMRWSIQEQDLLAIGEQPAEEEGGEPKPATYTVSPTSGYLAPGEVAALSVTFHAKEAGECAKQLRVDITDAEEPSVLGVVETLPIELTAEAYDIKVKVEWPGEAAATEEEPAYQGLDFGSFKVVDEQSSSLELINEGKYEVGFKFLFKSKMMRNILTLEPAEGVLEPAAGEGAPSRLKVAVTLKADAEYTLRDNPDVRLKFTELLTSEVLDNLTTPVRISAHSVFSKSVLVPKGINFGPMVYATTKERSFELTNTGEFDFDFTLRNAADGEAEAGKGGGPSIQLGRFTITPASGTVPTMGTATLVVKFAAGDGDEVCKETLVVDVADRDVGLEPDGVFYELSAESCIPGIDTKDFVNIFEEQAVHRTMTLAELGLPTNIFAEDEKLFCFGSHMVGRDVSERYKLSNPCKVPCKVLLNVQPRAAKPSGGKGDPPPAAGELPFDVEPKEVVIPPHEHRYITCFFKPTAMQTYNATLEAAVDLGTNPETKLLTFDVMAEGTLPHVSVVAPMARTDEGLPVLHFPKLLVGRTHRLPLTLRNEGVLPATVSLSQLLAPGPFSCAGLGQSLSLPAMGEETIDVVFKPVAAGEVASSINVSVHQNDFEDVAVQLKAVGEEKAVAFEELPEAAPAGATAGGAESKDGGAAAEALEDVLSFGDVEVGVPKTLTFTLRNFSEFARRFEWTSLPGLTFSPSIGHLPPHGSKPISATFSADEPLSHDAVEASASLALTKIAYPSAGARGAPAVEWDNSMVSVKYLTEEEFLAREARLAAEAAAAAEGEEGGEAVAAEPAAEAEGYELPEELTASQALSSPGRPRRKVTEVEPEPEHEVVELAEGEEAEPPLPLAVGAKCEYAQVECETSSLTFKPTMMFQVRSHTFPLTNTGAVALHYRWRVSALDGGREPLPPTEAPFSATPAHGVVPPGETVQVTVSFSPAEVDTFQRKLTCVCKNLQPDASAPTLVVSGKSSRPWAHFEIAESDYVRAGRRSPDMPGPDGSLGPLDPATKVIEFNSLGTRVRNTKRFYVINPTNKTYEFLWKTADDDMLNASDSMGAQPFRCQTRKGQVLAGRKFEMVFHFTPEAVDIAESHWRFQVAELGIDVPFLLVGTIQEPGVSLDMTRHDFGPLLIGQKAVQTIHIVNTEHLPFSYAFDKAFAPGLVNGAESVVSCDPLTGVVGPDSKQAIELTFAPSLEKNFNFNMELRVKNKPQPLVLNVKGQGYAIHDTLHLADATGKLIEISSFSPTRVDFGLVHVNDKIVRQLQISNSGRFNFDVSLSLKVPPGVRMPPVAVTPELATVRKGEKLQCQLAYSPTSEAMLPQGLSLQVQVTNGRTYSLQLLGKGKRPKLVFSFMKHDFGPCFVVTPKNGMQVRLLEIA